LETILTNIAKAIINGKRIGAAARTTLTSKKRFHFGTEVGGTGKSLCSQILFRYMIKFLELKFNGHPESDKSDYEQGTS
jgi:hypothetical protein